MDKYFSSVQLFSALHNRKINNFDTVCQNRQGMPANFGPKTLKLKKDDIWKVRKEQQVLCDGKKRQRFTSTPKAQHPPPPLHQVILWSKKKMHQNSIH